MDFEPGPLGVITSLWELGEEQRGQPLPSQEAAWAEETWEHSLKENKAEAPAEDDGWDLEMQDLWFGPLQDEDYWDLGP